METASSDKTALAVYWAHLVADRFPDGQLYANLRGFDPSGSVMDPAEAVRRCLDALHVPPERMPAELDDRAALYRSQLAGKRMLVVLDNARDTAQVRPLLPGTPTCLVLVTSRNQLTSLIAAEGAHPITLGLLTLDEAVQLLAQRLGADRLAAEPAAVKEIIACCAHLPLTLALVAARAAVRPHGGLHLLAEELRDTQHRWQTLAGDDPTSNAQAVLSWSYQTLSSAAARLFRLLGLHPGPDIATSAAASLAGVTTSTVRPMLAELTGASLLVEHIPGRYTFHDLLRAYASDLAHRIDTDQQRHTATHRMLDHYQHTAYGAVRLINPDPASARPHHTTPRDQPELPVDYQQALRWFTTEHQVLLAVIDHAAATGFDTHTWELAQTLAIFLYRQGHWHDWVTIGRTAVAAAQRLADPPTQSRAHRILAGAYTMLNRFDDAHTHLNHALELATQAGDQAGQAHTQNRIAYLWGQRGNPTQGLSHIQRAFDLYQAAGNQLGQARALNTTGYLHALLDDYQQALTYCQQAFALFQELGNRVGQAYTSAGLGNIHYHLGHNAQALICLQHGHTLLRDIDDRYHVAATLTRLGDTHHAIGMPQAARNAWQEALTIFNDLNHPLADKIRTKLTTQFPALHTENADQNDQPADRQTTKPPREGASWQEIDESKP